MGGKRNEEDWWVKVLVVATIGLRLRFTSAACEVILDQSHTFNLTSYTGWFLRIKWMRRNALNSLKEVQDKNVVNNLIV